MFLVHTMWLGSSIPIKYHNNIKTFRDLNKGFQHIHWEDRDVHNLLTESGLIELYESLPFMSKFNLAKYSVLHKFGGIYTDLDILWKKPFDQIINDQNFHSVDLVLTHPAYTNFYINNQLTNLLDDPFIISKQGLFNDCINYRLERSLRIDPETKQVHKAEPIGPFLLTEWVYNKNISTSVINQKGYLDWNGYYGNHDQLGLWNDKSGRGRGRSERA